MISIQWVRFDYANQYFSYKIQTNVNIKAMDFYVVKEVIGRSMNISSR